MSCSGLHCAGCGGGASVPVIALIALEGAAWVAAHVIEVAVVSAACGGLAVAAVVALMRWQERREAAYAAAHGIRSRADVILPAPPPRRELPQVVNNYFYVADTGTASRTRQALPVTVTQLPPGSHDQGTA